MSNYTTQVRYICENVIGSENSNASNVDEIIKEAYPKIFDFDFPIFREDYRETLCTKILKHYYTREIGAETVGLWKLWLNRRLNEIMPYYNQMYESAEIKFNPFDDINFSRTRKTDSNGTGTTINKSSNNYTNNQDRINKFSDTPQGALTGLLNDEYLTNATADTLNNTSSMNDNSNSNSSIKQNEDMSEIIKGKAGRNTYASMLKEYRTTFLNIDMKVIDDLSDLFMNIF